MSEYLVQIVPAPLYTDTNFVVSSTETIKRRNNIFHYNKSDSFKLIADVGTIFPVEQSETAEVQFTKEQLVHADTNDANWIHYSKHNISDRKRPLDYNTFVHTRTISSNESGHNREVPELSLQTIDKSIKNTNSTETTQNVENSPNTPNSTRSEAVYDRLSSNPDEVRESDRLEQNEFSDHSDMESFARLSESVFEAIEDTRDSVIDKPTTDEMRVIEKSKQARSCPICGKIYTASSSYFYHIKHFHKQSKEHSCDICGKKFGTRGDLKQHAAVHTEECKYACRSCDKKFRSRASWYIHEQIHEGVKNYKCPTCEKCFRWRTHLKRHTSRHAAERKHECGVCGRGFSVHCDLLRHARTHAVGSYECDECHVKFAQMRYLKTHLRKKHRVTVTGDTS